jgi:hypothetical protein
VQILKKQIAKQDLQKIPDTEGAREDKGRILAEK